MTGMMTPAHDLACCTLGLVYTSAVTTNSSSSNVDGTDDTEDADDIDSTDDVIRRQAAAPCVMDTYMGGSEGRGDCAGVDIIQFGG